MSYERNLLGHDKENHIWLSIPPQPTFDASVKRFKSTDYTRSSWNSNSIPGVHELYLPGNVRPCFTIQRDVVVEPVNRSGQVDEPAKKKSTWFNHFGRKGKGTDKRQQFPFCTFLFSHPTLSGATSKMWISPGGAKCTKLRCQFRCVSKWSGRMGQLSFREK